MFNQHTPHADDFIRRARARIEHMELAAGEVADALGLSREAKYDVLAAMATQQSEPVETSAPVSSLQTPLAEELGQWSEEQGLQAQQINGQVSPRRGGRTYWIATLAAVLVAALLVSSLLVVLNMAKQNRLASHTPAVSSSSTPGIYVAGSEGVYRLVQHNGKMTQQWFYKLSAPRAEAAVDSESTPFPIAFSLVDTPVTVIGNTAYFGGLEDDGVHNPHHYLYALNAQNGSLLWRHQIDGGGSSIAGPYIYRTPSTFAVALDPGNALSAPQVSGDMVYINVFTPQAGYIIALASNNGAVRWTYKYTYAGNNLNTIGQMGVISHGLIYVINGCTLFALRADNGHAQWSTSISQKLTVGQYAYAQTPQIADGAVYIAYIVSIWNTGGYCNRIYAFNAINGAQLWQSMVVNDQVFAAVISNGLVYLATNGGSIYALRVQDGTQVWKESAGGSTLATPQIMGGKLYVLHSSSQYPIYTLTRGGDTGYRV
ncbi:MAG: hypothetical protein NVS3B14_15450 [Ktedonobacteraceae bacterium]